MWTLRGKFSVQWIELTYAIVLLLMGVLWPLLLLSAKHGAPCCRKQTIYRPLHLPLLFLSSISISEEQCRVAHKTNCDFSSHPAADNHWEGLSLSPPRGLHNICDALALSPLLAAGESSPGFCPWPEMCHYLCCGLRAGFSTSLCPSFPLDITNKRQGLDSTDFAVFFLKAPSCSHPLGVSLVVLALLHPSNSLVMTPAWWTETRAGALWIETIVWK